MASAEFIRSVPKFDVDSHFSEPPDLWTSRMASKWGDLIPRTIWHEPSQEERWVIGASLLPGIGTTATAGWKEFIPSHPPRIEDCDPGAWKAEVRLERLDEYGIRTQLLFPNVLGFYSFGLLATNEPDFMLEATQVYNDAIAEWCSIDPQRLVPLMVLPFWDLDLSVKEIERCLANGHKGIVFSPDFTKVGFPHIADAYWSPVLDAAQSNNLVMNFHIGFSSFTDESLKAVAGAHAGGEDVDRVSLAGKYSLFALNNGKAIADIITSGLCERFPRLPFFSVESGWGFIPSLLDGLDWQFEKGGGHKEHPDWPRPSEVFRRQVYGSFWFERNSLRTVEFYPDNCMWESDYPHPTSLSPGPNSNSEIPQEMAVKSLAGTPEETARKILWDTASRLYHIDL